MRRAHTRDERTTSTTRSHVRYLYSCRDDRQSHVTIFLSIAAYYVHSILYFKRRSKKKTKQTSYEKRMGGKKEK